MISELLGELADWRGHRAREALKKKYPGGLKGRIGEVYRTRGKRIGRVFSNFNKKGFHSEEEVVARYSDVYEVVYHAKLEFIFEMSDGCKGGSPDHYHKDFVLSLFPEQLPLVGNDVTITSFGCVRHPFHFLSIGHSSTEVYPQIVEIHQDKI